MEKYFNRLGQEKSPYLLQHKDNPVHWFPWGQDAFRIAREESKPIFLSIGYSTCYWCHVMEKDSFELPEVADILNEHFVSIKLDREERPDVDQIYMDAVVALSGHGGWPMSVFLTPDLKPFFGGTFFWKPQFISLLQQISERWRENPELIRTSSKQFTEFLAQQDAAEPNTTPIGEHVFRQVMQQLQVSFDAEHGGFGRAPKFPHSELISLLLRIHRRSGAPLPLAMATSTLEKMTRGGLYDHLGGGFHRYSTDAEWLVPHFEKMLYDNALLAYAYLEAFQFTKNSLFREVARETLDYVLRDMTHPDGGFFSAEDAGDVGKEGEFYVWTYRELQSLLSPEELSTLESTYGVSEIGNFEHGQNILHLLPEFEWSVKKQPLLERIHQKLLAFRKTRTRPHRDDKILTDWNGLMIQAMAKGYQVLEDTRYLDAARNSAEFIRKHLYQDKKLKRRFREEASEHVCVVNDYAYLITGLLELYQTDFHPSWLHWAIELQHQQDELFWDRQHFGYFFSEAGDSSLILRKKEFHDGAIPSANAIATLNLLRLHDLTFEREYQTRAIKILEAMAGNLATRPSSFAAAVIALDYHLDRSKEVVVIGNPASTEGEELKRYLFQTFLPNKVLSFGTPSAITDPKVLPQFRGRGLLNNRLTIYVCENNTCKAPTNNLEDVKATLADCQKYELS